MDEEQSDKECPICCKKFPADVIEIHVNRCIFLNSTEETPKDNINKRSFSVFNAKHHNENSQSPESAKKRHRNDGILQNKTSSPSTSFASNKTVDENDAAKSIPLAEKMRPDSIDDYVGQSHIMGKEAILRKIFDKNEIPSMILWGPPGKSSIKKLFSNTSVIYLHFI